MNASSPSSAPRPALRTKVAIAVCLAAAAAVGVGWWMWSERQVPAAMPEATNASDTSTAPAPEGSVVLTAAQLRAQGVETAPVQSTAVLTIEGLPAQVLEPLTASAQVVAPYGGVVTRIMVDEGAPVRQGQALARIQSNEVLTASAELARARTEAGAASQQARRDAALLAEGIIAAARNEQSQARSAAAQSTLAEAQGALARLRPVHGGQAGEYELLAPISGQVVRRHVLPGQSVSAQEAAFVVAEPGLIDVQFSAPLRLRSDLRPGVEVRLPDGTAAHVAAVGADADASSQSLRVRARVDAGQAGALQYAPGQRFSVSLLLPAPEGTLSVPSSALLPSGSGHVLYVAEANGAEAGRDATRIRAVAVQLLGRSESSSAVRVVAAEGASASGQPPLAAGMQVVTRGTALFKSMIPSR